MVSLSRSQVFLDDPPAILGAGIGFQLVQRYLGILPGDKGFERSIAVLDGLLCNGFERCCSPQRECGDDSRDRFVSFRSASVTLWRWSARARGPGAAVAGKRPFDPTHRVEESG